MPAVDIVARLKLAGEQFTREFSSRMDKAEKDARTSSSKINAAFGSIKSFGGGLLAGVGVAALAAAGSRSLEYAASLGEVSQQLGVTTKDLQVYRFAATQVGIEQDAMDKSLAKLTQTIGKAATGGKQQGKVFQALGIEIRDANGHVRTAGDIIPELADALNKIPDPAQRAAVLIQLFGKNGQQLETLLAGGSKEVDNLRDAAHRLGVVLSEDEIQNADKTADKLAAMKAVLEANIAKTVAANSDAILGMANSLATLAGSLAQWWSQNPEQALAVLGALMGGRVGGLPGAALGGAAGFVLGNNQKQSRADGSLDIRFRRDQLAKAHQAYLNAAPDMGGGEILRIRSGGQKSRGNALEDLKREIGLMRGALGAIKPQGTPGAGAGGGLGGLDLSNLNAGGGGGRGRGEGDRAAKEAERAAEKAAQEQARIREAIDGTVAAQMESLRISTMRAQGLEREADIESAITSLRERYADDLAKLPEAQRKVTSEVADQLGLFEKQLAAAGALVASQGDALALTDAEKAARSEQLAALQSIAAAAGALVQTDADRLALAEALLRAEIGIEQAQEKGVDSAKRALDAARDRSRAEEEARDRYARHIQEQEDIQRGSIMDLADFYENALRSGGASVWEDFKDEGMRVLALIAAQWTIALISGQRASLPGILSQINGQGGGGGLLGGLLGAIGGRGKSGGVSETRVGGGFDQYAAMPGNLSKVVDGKLGSALGGISSAISTAAPYLAIAAAVLPLIGGLFKSSKSGSSTLGFSGGSLMAGTGAGNSSAMKANASGAMGEVAGSLSRIAEMLGGDVTGAGSVSIGQMDGKWRVDPSGRGQTHTKKGAIDFGKEGEAAAIRYAIADALRDGVIGGISDASKRILQSGQDLEKAISKAAMIEEIPKLLSARLDPVGAALDQLNDKWKATIAALKEGGASAAQMAEAQQLYKLELEETKARTVEASADMKAFLKSLEMGPSSPFSLRDQEEKARASLQPFLDKINAGDRVDSSKYQDAAQTYLDIERQLYGSTSKFFSALDLIQGSTGKAISAIDNAVPIRTAVDPFVQETASNTRATSEILDQHTGLLIEIRNGLTGLAGSAAPGSFIGSGRMFVEQTMRA